MAFEKRKKASLPNLGLSKNVKIVIVTLSVAKGLSMDFSEHLFEHQHFIDNSGPSLRSGGQPRFFSFFLKFRIALEECFWLNINSLGQEHFKGV